MRKLSESYWNRFLTTDKQGKLIRDGILFEDLVQKLLELSYPAIWKRTKKSHDFNRDFHLTTQDQKIWAECKNYSDDISVDTIAPTLVMAQIFTVNKIVFFSYSAINSSARRKIYAFASRTNKDIYIVDEYLLDSLIIMKRSELPENFRPSEKDIIAAGHPKECQVDFYFIQNPIIGATLEDREIIPVSQVEKINYNSVFEILVYCEPNSLAGDYRLILSAEESDEEINDNFELIDNKMMDLDQLKLSMDFIAASGYIHRILLKPRFYKSPLKLPVIKAEVFDAGKLLMSKKSTPKSVRNEWIGQTVLVGQQYREIVLNLEQKILHNSSISCFVIFGSSGTGKTRLLKESLEILLKHKYKIASFIGTEKDSARTILKEIIYFIYEVPRKEIFQHLERHLEEHFGLDAWEDTQIKAYQLARRIGDNLNDSELISFIDEYFDILYEKISSEQVAIVIDNLQFFSVPLIYFLQRYIDYAKHQTRPNRSVLILSVNQDYMNSDIQNFLDFVQELEKDRPEFSSHEITGFRDVNQAVVFLRELLNIKNEHSDAQLEILAKKASLIPYHIHQAVYSLLDDNIVRYSADNKGFIANVSKFYKAIEMLPDSIFKILEKRWRFLIDKNQLQENDCKAICSLISILGTISSEDISSFCLNEECLKIMIKHTFLREDLNGNYTFDHDIIEAFLLKYYKSKYYEIFNCIKEKGLFDEIMHYPFLEHFYQIKKSKVSLSTLKKIVNHSCAHQPPYKMVEPFFSRLIKVLQQYCKKFSDYEDWLNTISKACNALRNVIGFEKTLAYYQFINDSIEEIGIEEFLCFTGFRNYINTYTDILHHIGKSEDAICFLSNILEYIKDDREDDSFNALKSMVYNRLMINHREHETFYHISERNRCLAQSMTYAKKIKEMNLRDEFVYLNLSDEGYIYYSLEKNRKKLLSIWEKCKEYTPERLPQKTLNYYRKMIQLNLIYGNLKEADLYIEKMREYMESKPYTSERIIFTLFGLTAKTMCLILENPKEHYAEMIQNINNLMLLSKLRGGYKEYDVLNLKAIAAYYNGDYAGMLIAFNEAYHIIKHARATMHLREKTELLASNIICACNDRGFIEDLKVILYDKSPVWIDDQCQLYRDKGIQAKGILHTPDLKFNLPLVV